MQQCTECKMWYFTEWGIRGHLCLPGAREVMIAEHNSLKRDDYYDWFDGEFGLKPI